jgi:tetratricopeptide (TPR) repeat protein
MVARDPKLQAQSYVDQGLDASDDGNVEMALQYLDRALALDPQHAQAWYCKASLLGDLGKLEEAIECYQQSAEHAEDHAHLPLFNLGNLYQEVERFEQALACFELATEVNPEMTDAWINRGRLLDERDHHEEAIQCYDRAIQLDRGDLMAWTNRGNSFAALGDFREAQRSYQAALELDETDALAQLGSAICTARLGDWETGLEKMDRIVELQSSPLWNMEKAQILVELKRWAEALELVEAAIDAASDFPESWCLRGQILVELKDDELALASYRQALQHDPSFAAACWGQAKLLDRISNARDAGHAETIESLQSYFEHADAGHANYAEAIALAEQLELEIPESASRRWKYVAAPEPPSKTCDCCDDTVQFRMGHVEQKNEVIADYWAQLPASHQGLYSLAIGLRDNDHCGQVMVLQAEANPQGVTLWVMGLRDSPWTEFVDREVLSREEGLAHPAKDHFFQLADFINVSDPKIQQFILSFLER